MGYGTFFDVICVRFGVDRTILHRFVQMIQNNVIYNFVQILVRFIFQSTLQQMIVDINWCEFKIIQVSGLALD